MDEHITDAEFPGKGPFAIPLLARFIEIHTVAGKDFAIAKFEFEDGVLVHVPIAILAADKLAAGSAEWQKFRAEVAASGSSLKH